MELPRYICATEVGFLPKPVEITFAKQDRKVGVGQRVEEGDEFTYDGTPGKWMEPINEAAIAKVQESISAQKRKTVAAEHKAATVPVVPPRSGMASAIVGQAQHPSMHSDVNTGPTVAAQPAPRRRAKAS